ncbi:MAG: hypothetical protein PHO30_03775 [Candidatus Omnitrophica bacterium]|nr:hypothetical protein [Candidatus Omnitrophota bacterium]
METLFYDPAREMLEKIISFASLSLVALLVVVIGWIISKGVRSLISRMLKKMKLDKLSERSGIAKFLSKGEIKYTLSDLIALIIYWLLMLITIMVTANVLGLTVVAELMDTVVLYVPNVLAALMVLVIGALIAVFVRKVVETTSKNAGLTHAKSMGILTHTVIVVFSVIIALEQLKIGVTILTQCITIMIGSVGLALALAFGLGCKDIAAKAMLSFLETTKSDHKK